MLRCMKSTMTHNSVSGHDTNPRVLCCLELGHKGPHKFMVEELDNKGAVIPGSQREYKYQLPMPGSRSQRPLFYPRRVKGIDSEGR